MKLKGIFCVVVVCLWEIWGKSLSFNPAMIKIIHRNFYEFLLLKVFFTDF